MKQISVRLEDALHNKVRHMLLDLNKSFNEYVTELIRQDLEEKAKKKQTKQGD